MTKVEVEDENSPLGSTELGSTETESENSDADATKPVAKRVACGCCACCGCLAVSAMIAAICLGFYLNQTVQAGVHVVGSSLLGVDVSVGGVDIGLLHGRASITDMTVASPEGYDDDLFRLGQFEFDLAPSSIFTAWWSNFERPIILKNLTVYDVVVSIEGRNLGVQSNAQEVIAHVDRTVKGISPGKKPAKADLKAMLAKIRVDHLHIENVSIAASLPPLASTRYALEAVKVEDVGKTSDGVYLFEFIEIFVRALLMAVVKGAPDKVRVLMASAFGGDLWKKLDCGRVSFDAGRGLQKLGEFADWVSAEAATLPTRLAEIGAGTAGAGAAWYEKALEIGSGWTHMAASAQARTAESEEASPAGLALSQADFVA